MTIFEHLNIIIRHLTRTPDQALAERSLIWLNETLPSSLDLYISGTPLQAITSLLHIGNRALTFFLATGPSTTRKRRQPERQHNLPAPKRKSTPLEAIPCMIPQQDGSPICLKNYALQGCTNPDCKRPHSTQNRHTLPTPVQDFIEKAWGQK